MPDNKINFGLLPEKELDPRDHFLGASDTAPVVTNDPLNFWKQFTPTKEIQMTVNGDSNACVTFSCLNAFEYYFNYLISKDGGVKKILEKLGCIDENGKANFSERFTAQMSGTDPDGGNTVTAVVESIRKDGLLGQKFLPTKDDITKQEFYSGITQEMKDQAKKILEFFDLKHAWLPTEYNWNSNSEQQIIEGLKKGVIRVSVDGGGYWDKDENGYIKANKNEGKGYIYSHSVTKVGGEQDKYNLIHDHYTNQFPLFKWNYPFGNGKLLYVTPKKKLYQLIKVSGKPAVYICNNYSKNCYGIADGDDEITGGDLIKAFSGSYGNAGIASISEEEFTSTYKIRGEVKTNNF